MNATTPEQRQAYREGLQDGRDGQDHRTAYPWATVYFYLGGLDDARAVCPVCGKYSRHIPNGSACLRVQRRGENPS
jgi:hypothetical protein